MQAHFIEDDDEKTLNIKEFAVYVRTAKPSHPSHNPWIGLEHINKGANDFGSATEGNQDPTVNISFLS